MNKKKKPITIASRKAKGRKIQNEARELLLKSFTILQPGDIKTATGGEKGTDLHFSPLAKEVIPFDCAECKNQEKLNIWSALKQMESHGKKPVLFFTRNNTPIYVAMRADFFLDDIV